MNKIKITIGILLLSLTATAKAEKIWRLPELARAANSLIVEMDQGLANKKTVCGLSSDQVSAASQSLKALVDGRVEQLKNENKSAEVRSLLKRCRADCTCETYEYAIEKLSGNPVTSTKSLGVDERAACAAKYGPICKTKIFKALK